MNATKIRNERSRIDQVIRSTAWVMLIIGILVVSSGFVIQGEYNKVNLIKHDQRHTDNRCLPKIPELHEQYWCGFLVSFTSLILLANYSSWSSIEEQLPTLLKQKFFAGVMILLSMLSGLAVMSQDAETLGRIRQNHLNSAYCEEYDEENHQENRFHYHQILHWLYLIILSANVLVVVCLVLIMAFLANWILETILGATKRYKHSCAKSFCNLYRSKCGRALNSEQQNSEDDQPPPAYSLDHVASCSNDVQDCIPLQTNELLPLS